MRIGFIGAGRMGGPVVDRLIAANHAVTVLARSDERVDEGRSRGWSTAPTIAETVHGADLVVCMVLSDAQVRDALGGADGAIAAMPTGSVLVQHTTCDPATLVEFDALSTARGIRFLDAAISGGPRDILAGALTLWVGGEAATLDSARPALAAYASPVVHVGPVGNGQRVKLVNNALFVSQVALAVDAVRLAESFGIDESVILDAVAHGSGDSRGLQTLAWIGVDQVGLRLAELMSKDVDVIRTIAARSGADLGLLGQVLGSEVVEETILCRSAMPERSLIGATAREPKAMKAPERTSTS